LIERSSRSANRLIDSYSSSGSLRLVFTSLIITLLLASCAVSCNSSTLLSILQ
jgi:hypothetical protein